MPTLYIVAGVLGVEVFPGRRIRRREHLHGFKTSNPPVDDDRKGAGSHPGDLQGGSTHPGRHGQLPQGTTGFTTAVGNATVVSYVYDPNVLTHDLERAYSKIEDAGTPVIAKLRDGTREISDIERAALIAFLDMHLERGRYADLVKLRVPAVLIMNDGTSEDAELALGDVMTLSQSHPDVFRLSSLPLNEWEWKVLDAVGLATGDGAVFLWRPSKDAEISTISFPLSPTQLLVIGQDLPDGLSLNTRIAQNSRRWIVGTKGSLNLTQANAPRKSSPASDK